MARGKGKKEAMIHVNLRLPVEILEYYKQFPSYTIAMRDVLKEHVKQQEGESDARETG